MAVTFDNVGPSSSGYAVSAPGLSPSWSHTVSASATLLLAWLTIDGLASETVTCKAGTSSMTAAAANPISNNGSSVAYAFYLFSPPTGSATVAFTLSGSTPGGYVCGGSLSFDGATGLGTPAVVSGTQIGASMTLTCTGVASTSMVAGFMSLGDPPVSPSTGTNQFQADGAGSGGNTDGNAAGATNTGSGSVSIVWSGLPGSDSHAGWAVEVQGAAAGPALTPMLPNFPVSIVTRPGWRNAGHSR